jgi:hypothetical protein
VTTQEALDAFGELRARASASGIAMDTDTINVQPMPSLSRAIQFAVTSGSQNGA